MTDVEMLAEEVEKLRERILYLESVIDESVEEKRFEKKIESLRGVESIKEIVERNIGGYYAIVIVQDCNLPRFIHNVNRCDDIGWSVDGHPDEQRSRIRVQQGLNQSYEA